MSNYTAGLYDARRAPPSVVLKWIGAVPRARETLMADRNQTRATAAFFCALSLVVAAASAHPPDVDLDLGRGVRLLADEPDLVCGGAGVFDVLREGYSAGNTTGYSFAGLAEYRLGHKLLFAGPLVGILANSHGGAFGYAGLFFDFALGPLRFAPMLSAGGYRRGESKDLGGVFEFHSGASLAYQFEHGSRIGLEMNHISNANIHYRNPGVELILVTFMFPLR